jgi:hypothetical protein
VGHEPGVRKTRPAHDRRVMGDVVMAMREKETAFQVFYHCPESNLAAIGSATPWIESGWDRHGPSWAKRPPPEEIPIGFLT